jgi:hypothetical protein
MLYQIIKIISNLLPFIKRQQKIDPGEDCLAPTNEPEREAKKRRQNKVLNKGLE